MYQRRALPVPVVVSGRRALAQAAHEPELTIGLQKTKGKMRYRMERLGIK